MNLVKQTNPTLDREARIRFSDRLASKMVSTGALGTAIFNARQEMEGWDQNIYCDKCPYSSRSFHEASMHARLHDDSAVETRKARFARQVARPYQEGRPFQDMVLGITYNLFGKPKLEVVTLSCS